MNQNQNQNFMGGQNGGAGNNNLQNELLTYDNSFNYAIISLLSHMKPNQIKDLLNEIN